jgi:hypothetical protein
VVAAADADGCAGALAVISAEIKVIMLVTVE